MDPNEQKERMEEILLTATNERKKIQEVKLPGVILWKMTL